MNALDVIEGRASWAVVQGDCLEILPTLPARSVAHVVTDPPFSAHVHERFGREGRSDGATARGGIGFAALTDSLRQSISAEACRLASRWMLVFTDELGIHGWVGDIEAGGGQYIRKGTWVKTAPMPQMSGDRPACGTEEIVICHGARPARSLRNTHRRPRLRWNGGGRSAVWIANNQEAGRVHPTQKPLPLMLELVADFTDPGDLVLDPFCGAGTTGVACLRLGRRFIGIEKNEQYAAVACERLEAESKGLTLRDARAGQMSILEAL